MIAPGSLLATTSNPDVAIGAQGVAAALLLVVVAVVVSWRQGLGLERALAGASARGLVQLLLTGVALGLLFAPSTPLAASIAWVVGMVLFAGWTVQRRAPEVPGLFPLATAALGTAGVVTLGVVFALGIFPLEPRYLVPTAGMMVGNAMNMAVLGARRTVDELREHRDEVEARVALGQPWRTAAGHLLRRSLRDAMTPQIETTRAVGLVFLPGAMTGLILGGVDPVDAVLVQAAIMFLILGGVAISAVVIVLGLARRLFTDDDRMAALPRV